MRAHLIHEIDHALSEANTKISLVLIEDEGYRSTGARLTTGDLPVVAYSLLEEFGHHHGDCPCPMQKAVETAKAVLEPMVVEVNHA